MKQTVDVSVGVKRQRFVSDCEVYRPPIEYIPARRPAMFPAEYGRSNSWALDVFTLPHNAIRSECVDLFNILESMHVRSVEVSDKEMDELFSWWSVYESFVIEYFDFEADLLFPWVFVDGVANIPLPDWPVDKHGAQRKLQASLEERKESFLNLLSHINGTFELRLHVDTADIFPTLMNDVNHFVPQLLEYFQVQERYLPALINRLYKPSARDSFTRKYIAYIRRGEFPQMHLPMLSAWMDLAVRDRWVRENIRGLTRFRFPRWYKRYLVEHRQIPRQFSRRSYKALRDVAASQIRRRAEFGEEINEVDSCNSISFSGLRGLAQAAGKTPNTRSIVTQKQSQKTELFELKVDELRKPRAAEI